ADNKLADKNMIKPGQELCVKKKQHANHADAKTAKALPETGSENNNSNNGTLFGGLFAALGSLLLFGRRKKQNK
ncbi:immunoglobulin G-binding protein A, partial [Staphylococcus aureus]|uniref:MSCRAMM family adhesin SdrC n=1 Tax=Staphylococcus aureus TaxID=1280 RepID=UPI0021CDEAD6